MLITRNSDLPSGLLYSRSRFTYLCTISMTDINSTQEVGKKSPTCTILSSQSQGSFLSREHLTAVPHRFLLCLSFFLPSLHLIVTQPRKGLVALNMYSILVLKLDTQRKPFSSSQRKREKTIPIEHPSLPAEIIINRDSSL